MRAQIDSFLEKHFQGYVLSKKLKRYKEKLGAYAQFKLSKCLYYEKKWKYLKRKYKQIYVYGIEYVSIGETIPRFFNLIDDVSKSDKNSYHVVLPTFFDYFTGGIYNRKMLELFARKIYLIRDKNIDFWTYVFGVHAGELHLEKFDKYVATRLGGVKVDLYKSRIPFYREELVEGADKLHAMGITGNYICVHARESEVKNIDFCKKAGDESSCRNWELDTFYQTSRYLQALNIQSVRLGKYEKKKCEEETIIDYANLYYDEFMDFYLLSKAKFLVCGDTGVLIMGGYCGCPVLEVNTVAVVYCGESRPDTGYDMYIPKKFYSKKKKRYLNMYEMLDIMDECGILTSNYRKRGIVLEDNTDEEILQATIEMNARLENVWTETEDERVHYSMYWKILECWSKKNKNVKVRKCNGWDGYTMNFYKLSYSYLKDNLYLLDVDEAYFK